MALMPLFSHFQAIERKIKKKLNVVIEYCVSAVIIIVVVIAAAATVQVERYK